VAHRQAIAAWEKQKRKEMIIMSSTGNAYNTFGSSFGFAGAKKIRAKKRSTRRRTTKRRNSKRDK
jgi:hypothetical protein